MTKYLGETPVDILTHPDFAGRTPNDWAIEWISRYGQIDDARHKAWVLDQVARILKGTPVLVTQAAWSDGQTEYRVNTGEPSHDYLAWVKEMMAGEHGPNTYQYDCGVAP